MFVNYKVRSGDTLGRLAKQYKTDLKSIQEWNPSIKDVNKIYVGQIIKFRKKEAVSFLTYEKAFEQGMDRLYTGHYGTIGGREKLGEELVKKYPKVDVWKDIYDRIPNFWEKIAFPETVKLPKELPETKLPAWQKVGSFISEKIKIPIQQRVKKTAWNLFSKIPYVPSPEEIYEQAKLKVRDEIFVPHKERLEAEREKQLGPQITGIIKYTKPVIEELKINARKVFQKIDQKYIEKMEKISRTEPAKYLWPLIGPYLKEKDLKKIKDKEEFEKGEEEARLKIDLDTLTTTEQSSLGYLQIVQDDIWKKKEDWAETNIILNLDSYGWVYVDEEKTKASFERFNKETLKEWQDIYGPSDPIINQFLDFQTKAQENQNNLMYYLIGDLNYLKTVLTSPALSKNKENQALLKNLDQIIETGSFLESIDPTLVDIQSELDRHNRSALDVDIYYKEEVPKWWDKVEALIGKEMTGKIKSDELLSETESDNLTTILTELPISKLNQYQSLMKRISQSQVFFRVENNLKDLILQPHSLDSLIEIYKQHPEASAGRLTALKNAIQDQEWSEENIKTIEDADKNKILPFFKKLEEALTPEQFEKLRDDVISNDAITKKQIDLALKFINYEEKRIKNLKEMEEKFQEFGKIARIHERHKDRSTLEESRKRSQELDHFLTTPTYKVLAFPASRDATWDDFKLYAVGTLSTLSDKIDPKTKKTFGDGLHTVFDAIDLLYYKYSVPFINMGLTNNLEELGYIGQELAASDIPFIKKTGKWTIQKYQALKAVYGGVPLEKLEKQLPPWKDRTVGERIKRLEILFEYFQSPDAYEEITIKEDTRVEYKDGAVKIGNLTFDALKTREDLILWNPKLKDSRFIKAGTKLTLPKWVRGPRYTDMLTDQARYEFYQKNPGTAVLLDEFLPFVLSPNIESLIIKSSRSLGVRLSMKAAQAGLKDPVIGLQGIKNARTIWGSTRTAESLNKSMIASENFIKVFTLKHGVDWKVFGQNDLVKTLTVPLENVRAKILQTTIIKGLPSEISQQMIAKSLEEVKKTVDVALIDTKIKTILDDTLGELGMSKEWARKFRLAIFDPRVVPEESIQKVCRLLGWFTYDIFDLVKKDKGLKESIKAFYNINRSREPIFRAMIWEENFQKLGEQGKDYFFNVVWKDWSQPKGFRKIKSKELMEKARIEYLRERVHQPNFKKIKKEVDEAQNFLRFYLKEREAAREIGERVKLLVRLPNNVDLIPVASKKAMEDLKHLGKKGILKFNTKSNRLEFIFNPKAYSLREYELIGDLMNQFLDLRLLKLDDIPYGEAGTRMFTTREGQKIAKPVYVILELDPKGQIFRNGKHWRIKWTGVDSEIIEDIGKGKTAWAKLKDGAEQFKILRERGEILTPQETGLTLKSFKNITEALESKPNFINIIRSKGKKYWQDKLEQAGAFIPGPVKSREERFYKLIKPFGKDAEAYIKKNRARTSRKWLEPSDSLLEKMGLRYLNKERSQIFRYQRTPGGPFVVSGLTKEIKGKISEVIRNPQKVFSLKDSLTSDFIRNFWMKKGAPEIKDFLKANFAIKKGERSINVTTRQEDWKTKNVINFVADKGFEPFKMEKIKIRDVTEIISPEGITFFMKRAAILDFNKGTLGGRKSLNRYKKYLSSIKGSNMDTPMTILDRLLINEYEFKPILPTLSQILLLEDSASIANLEVLRKNLNYFLDAFAKDKYKNIKKAWEATGKKEKLEPYKILLSAEDINTEVKEMQSLFKLGFRDETINQIIPKVWGHIPGERKMDSTIGKIIEQAGAIATNQVRENLRTIFKTKGEKFGIEVKRFLEQPLPWKNNVVKIFTQPSWKGKLSAADKAKLDQLFSKGKRFLLLNETKKDKAIIEYLTQKAYPFKIFVPPSTKEFTLSAPEILKRVKDMGDGILNPDNILSDQSFLRLLDYYSGARYQVEKALPRFIKGKFVKKTLMEKKLKPRLEEEAKRRLRTAIVLETLQTKKGKDFLKNLEDIKTKDAIKRIKEGTATPIERNEFGKVMSEFGYSSDETEMIFKKGKGLPFDLVSAQHNLPESYFALIERNLSNTLEVLKGNGIKIYGSFEKKLLVKPTVKGKKIPWIYSMDRKPLVGRLNFDYKGSPFEFKQSSLAAGDGPYLGRLIPKLSSFLERKPVAPIKVNQVLSDLSNILHLDTFQTYRLYKVYISKLDKVYKLQQKRIELVKLGEKYEAAYEQIELGLEKVKGLKKVKELKKLDEVKEKIWRVSKEIDRVDNQLDIFEDISIKALVAAGNPLYPSSVSDNFLTFCLEGTTKMGDALISIDHRIDEIRKLLALSKKKLPVKGEWIAVNFNKRKERVLKSIDRFELEKELKNLQASRKLIPELKKIEDAGLRISEHELFNFSKGKVSISLSKRFRKAEEALGKKVADQRAPIFLDETAQKLYNAFPKIRSEIKLHEMKTEKADILLDKYLSNVFSKDYVSPLIKIQTKKPGSLRVFVEQANGFIAKRYKTIVDMDNVLTKSEIKFLEARGIQVKTINEFKSVAISQVGELPLKDEFNAFMKLREIFLNDRKIILLSSDIEKMKFIRTKLESVYLSKTEERIIKAVRNLIKEGEKQAPLEPGLPYKFAERAKISQIKTPEMQTAIGYSTFEKLAPGKVIEEGARKYSVDKAFQEVLNKTLENGMYKKLFETTNYTDKVPTLIIGGNSRFVSGSNLKKLETAVKFQKAELYLPRTQNLTPGEQTIKEFLDSKKISYKFLKTELKSEYLLDPLKSKIAIEVSKEYPLFIFPMSRNLEETRKVFVANAISSYRIFKPLDQLKTETLNVTREYLQKWMYSVKKEVPMFMSLKKWGLPTNPKALMADLLKYGRRKESKQYWMAEKDKALELSKRVWMKDYMKEIGIKSEKELTKSGKMWVDSKYEGIEDIGKTLDKMCGWDKPLPWWENIEHAIAKKLDLRYALNKGYYVKQGFPVPGFKHNQDFIKVLESTLKSIEVGKNTFRGVQTVLGLGRSAWILSILFWNMAWHLKNNWDDSVKNFIKTKSLRNFAFTHSLFWRTTARFSQKFIKDLSLVPSFVNKLSKKESDELSKILGKKFKAKVAPFEVFEPGTLMRAKEIKNWKKFSEAEKIKAVNKNPLYLELALKEGPVLTPKGELLTGDGASYITETGLLQMFLDPIERRAAISALSETSMFKRFWKRAHVLNADIEAYANFMESMRRQVLMHDLLFNKAMSLAEARKGTWRWLFNYRDLTIVGKTFRNFFPFYAFQSKSFYLWTTEIAKGGPKRIAAAKAFMDAWNASVEELPEWARFRIYIGGHYYLYPWGSIWETLQFWSDPVKSLRTAAENPLALPMGLGWSPFYSSVIGEITKKKFFDVSTDFRREHGYSEEQIEKIIEKEKLIRDLSVPGKIKELLTTYLPFTKLGFMLGEVDRYMLMDGISIWKSKKFKAFAKQFGLNILEWNEMDIAMSALFDSPPQYQKEIERQIKKENPEVWDMMQRYFAKTSFIKAARLGKIDPEAATLYLKQRGYLSQYYEMEWKKPGSGKLWLERNKDARETISDYFEAKDTINPWKMIQRSMYNRNLLASQVRILIDKTFPEETIKKAEEDLGIDINFAIIGSKKDFQEMLFDEHGKLKISSMQELESIMGQKWVLDIINKTKKTWQEYIKKEAELNYHEWLYIKQEAKTKEEKDYADRMAKWQKLLPKNINDLSDKQAAPYWNKYWIYFEKFFSNEEKIEYYLGLKTNKGEWYYEYRKKIQDYIRIWGEMFKKFDSENYQFYEDFYSQPDWWKNLYFRENPNKKKWFPFARTWVRMLEKIRDQEEKGIFNEKERKTASDYFWKHKDLIKLWDKDNPGFYDYMKRWQAVIQISEAHPEKYYPAFYSQPLAFRERFFKKNPDARIYYPFVYKWTQLIQQDQKHLEETGERLRTSNDFFWAPENKRKRELYGKHKKVDATHSILDYLTIQKDNWNEVGEEINKYFDIFFASPDWYQKVFFGKHPNKEKYYWFAREAGKKEDDKWSEYFWQSGKKFEEARQAWNKEKPGHIDYMRTWKKIIDASKDNIEAFYPTFYAQNLEFREKFFKKNPNARIYYPFVYKWTQLIQKDKENLEKTGVRSRLSNDFFWAPENKRKRELYGEHKKVDDVHSILEYLTIQKDNWEEIGDDIDKYYNVFYSAPDWYRKVYFKKNPEKLKYYWFAFELGKQKSEDWSDYFWKEGAKFNTARRAWDKANPGFLDYMGVWKRLGNLAKKGEWDTYFKVYWSPNNLEFRKRHWKSHPEAKERYTLMKQYQELPSKTWEDRKSKRDFLHANPKLKEWWAKDISEEDAKLSSLVEEYYKIVDSIPADGIGLDYYKLVRKKELEGERFKRDNPEMVAYLHKNAEKETGERPEIYNLLAEYSELTMPDEKQKFLKEHPEVKEYFLNAKPPGIRRVIKLQDQYFTLSNLQKPGFLIIHPELVEYWESRKLPESYFFNPASFASFQNIVDNSHNYFQKCIAGNWAQAEILRQDFSDIYWNPGITEEAEWMKQKIYRDAMHTWSILSKKDDDMKAIYFFRQLPDWVRDIYYSRHPEKQYLSKYSLSRFLEEPLRLEAYANPELAWANFMFQKYGRNMPSELEDKIRKIMIKFGKWEDRSVWSSEKWSKYWRDRSMYLNSLQEYDLAKIPLLRKELDRVIKSFPLKIKPKPFKRPRLGVCHVEF